MLKAIFAMSFFVSIGFGLVLIACSIVNHAIGMDFIMGTVFVLGGVMLFGPVMEICDCIAWERRH